ncbi:MAG: SsrA-binding protein SmpB [Coriobacteriales bacterium]|jgi:SsrA-binding protein|nr:SsrA-binding protein SmpB [Coriobacteriales bacterium]
MGKSGNKLRDLARNRRAFFDYEIQEVFEAGIVLTGTEVRSLREGGGQLTDTFALIRRGEAWLHGLHIRPYSHGNRSNPDPDRVRKLLLHKRQIRYLGDKLAQAGLTLVPIKLYLAASGLVKVELGLAQGKKRYDKRVALAKRESLREIERALKARG